MITVGIWLTLAWLLSFIGVDTIFDNLLGFDKQLYYLTFFAMGLIVWIARIVRK